MQTQYLYTFLFTFNTTDTGALREVYVTVENNNVAQARDLATIVFDNSNQEINSTRCVIHLTQIEPVNG